MGLDKKAAGKITGKREGRARSPEVESSGGSNIQTIETSKIVKLDWIRDLFDSRTPHEQAVLTEDIKRNGLVTPVTLSRIGDDEYCLVDGFGRIEAYETLGITKIAYEIRLLSTEDAIKSFMMRRQLGRRNLSPQAKAKIIGNLPGSIAELAKEFNKSDRYISKCRSYCQALEKLKNVDIKKIHELPISQVIAKAKNHGKPAKPFRFSYSQEIPSDVGTLSDNQKEELKEKIEQTVTDFLAKLKNSKEK